MLGMACDLHNTFTCFNPLMHSCRLVLSLQTAVVEKALGMTRWGPAWLWNHIMSGKSFASISFAGS